MLQEEGVAVTRDRQRDKYIYYKGGLVSRGYVTLPPTFNYPPTIVHDNRRNNNTIHCFRQR